MSSLPEVARLASLILLVVFALLVLFFTARVRRGQTPLLRPIAAFETLKNLMARAIEAGQTIHLSLGTGGITNRAAAETLAGLTVLEHISGQAAAARIPPITTTADPAVMLLAQNVLCNAYGSDRHGVSRAAAQVRWISPEPAAYAAGVMGVLSLEEIDGNIMIGRFGDEYLLMGETAHRQRKPVATVAGAADPNVLPYVFATAPQGLWGEEMFAAGAYLAQKPAHIASLLAQDTVRWLTGLVILGSVLLKAFGVLG
ncbi:MAG: DUF6754 domain-containing protein [Anaerolineae bacterium]